VEILCLLDKNARSPFDNEDSEQDDAAARVNVDAPITGHHAGAG
jgi:hypothetical protein